MPKGNIYKIPIDQKIFKSVVHECGSSIKKLGACTEVHCTERTLSRAMKEGKITPTFLDQIARYLDVSPRLLSGSLHKHARSYNNELLRNISLAQLKAKNYPYFEQRKTDLNKQPIGELLEKILALFDISFSQFKKMDFEAQYLFQHDLLEALVPVIRKHFKADAYGQEKMPNLEKVILDLEYYREDHDLQLYADEVLRKRFLENPSLGKTREDILAMSADALIGLDMYDQHKE